MEELKIGIKWPYKLEKEFTTAFLKELKKKWYFIYKISDAWIWIKPFDCIIVSDKAWYYIEIKLIDNDIFYINRLRDNQYTALKHIYTLDNNKLLLIPLVIVYSKKQNKYSIIPFNKIIWMDRNNRIRLTFS